LQPLKTKKQKKMGRAGNLAASPAAFSSPLHMGDYDISRMTRIEFNRLKDLVATYARTPGLSFWERRQCALEFVRACSATVAAEQAVLLPLLRRFPGDVSPALVERAGRRRAGLLRALEELDAARPDSPQHDALLERCYVLLTAAFAEMDQRLLPVLDRACGARERNAQGHRFYLYRLLFAPTRPHSWIPADMAGGLVGAAVNAALAPLDWARDLARFGLALPV
jgi:hypothetical protein